MSDSADNRPASTPHAAEPPMPKLPANLAPPAAAGSAPREPQPFESDMPAADRSVLEPAPADPAAVDEFRPEPSSIDPDVGRTAGEEAAADKRARRASLRLTRTSAAWLGVWAGVLAVIVLIIFVAQNTYRVEINFLWLHGHISLALALLIAGVAGAAVAMAVAAARILQLRRLVRRTR